LFSRQTADLIIAMTSTHSNSIALLIDADNAPSGKIDFILSELAGHGVVNIRRAYGNWTKPTLAGWIKVLQENSIQPMQSFDIVKGKNATDMSLLIDAMDLLYTKKVNTFCLVSSDSDFTPLIQRLRADGKEVFGFGEEKTPGPMIASCTRFIYLEDKKPAKPAKTTEAKVKTSLPAKQNPKGNTKLMTTLRNAVSASADEEGWANLSNIPNRINNEGPFDHRTYGFKKLVDLFEAIDLFEVRREKTASHTVTFVRIAKVGGKKVKMIELYDGDDIPF
jgi:uncharacterized protein (TIGR00288 family)